MLQIIEHLQQIETFRTTPVRRMTMSDGSTKKVEDVKIGDKLKGCT